MPLLMKQNIQIHKQQCNSSFDSSIPYLPEDITDGFNNAASLDGTTGNTGQQRSECKIVPRRDYVNLISRIVKIPQETCSCPTSSQHQHLFLLRYRGFRCSNRLTVCQKTTATASIKPNHSHNQFIININK